ncbi:hypothetical protein B0H10DRAFT_1969625 [Mycena sp. CBHHK59/15]|nr:hypothetical protein B0H10DRAFT_1969625 [Mycena sp. CBHHK59/15]
MSVGRVFQPISGLAENVNLHVSSMDLESACSVDFALGQINILASIMPKLSKRPLRRILQMHNVDFALNSIIALPTVMTPTLPIQLGRQNPAFFWPLVTVYKCERQQLPETNAEWRTLKLRQGSLSWRQSLTSRGFIEGVGHVHMWSRRHALHTSGLREHIYVNNDRRS